MPSPAGCWRRGTPTSVRCDRRSTHPTSRSGPNAFVVPGLDQSVWRASDRGDVERGGERVARRGGLRGRRLWRGELGRAPAALREQIGIRTDWRTARVSSAGTTWSTPTRCWWRSIRAGQTRPCSRRRFRSMTSITLASIRSFRFPMGNLQPVGKLQGAMMRGAAPYAPDWSLRAAAQRSVDWWVMSEDLPDPANRVTLDSQRGHRHPLASQQSGGSRPTDGPRQSDATARRLSGSARSPDGDCHELASMRHAPVRPRPGSVGARPLLSRARPRQPVRRRCLVLSFVGCGQSGVDYRGAGACASEITCGSDSGLPCRRSERQELQ